MEMLPLTYEGAALRILCAVFLGGLLGLDRGLKTARRGCAPTCWCVWAPA